MGRHEACPYRTVERGKGRCRAGVGRHKACPYGDGECEWGGRRTGRAGAGTRPSPTGMVGVDGEDDVGGRAWVGARPGPMGILWDWGTWFGEALSIRDCYEYRHQVGEACCWGGGVAGAEPPHKGGPQARPPGTAGARVWGPRASNCNVNTLICEGVRRALLAWPAAVFRIWGESAGAGKGGGGFG